MKIKLLVSIIVLAVFLLGAGLLCYLLTQPQENPVVCTLEAKLCPDGSAVGRIGPNCEFAACPGIDETADWLTYTNQENGFEIKYPVNFLNEKPLSAIVLLYLRLNDEKYKDTGLDYAQVIIDMVCVFDGSQTPVEVNINGQIFNRYNIEDNAMGGQRGTGYVYRINKDDKCFNIEGFLAYHDTRGFTDQPRWLEVDQVSEILTYFEQIASTFKFTK